MSLQLFIKSSITLMFSLLPAMAMADSVDVLNTDTAEIQKTVIGVWAANEKITFANSGTYSILLTDFGMTQPGFGNSFNYLGAMISSSTDNLAAVTFDHSNNVANKFLSFDVVAGDYWLNIFAVTDSKTNAGTFNFQVLEGDLNPVPLPASFWLMATSLLGLFSFIRQSRSNKKCSTPSGSAGQLA